MKKPEFLTLDHLDFLDELSDEGKNMFNATPYLEDEFPELDKEERKEVLLYWVESEVLMYWMEYEVRNK